MVIMLGFRNKNKKMKVYSNLNLSNNISVNETTTRISIIPISGEITPALVTTGTGTVTTALDLTNGIIRRDHLTASNQSGEAWFIIQLVIPSDFISFGSVTIRTFRNANSTSFVMNLYKAGLDQIDSIFSNVNIRPTTNDTYQFFSATPGSTYSPNETILFQMISTLPASGLHGVADLIIRYNRKV
jgi:hypothetical protein